MKIKGVHLLNNAATKFAHSLGCDDVHCMVGKEFAYYPNEELITFPIWQEERLDRYFMKYLKSQNYVEIDNRTNPFVLSLLHEIGHYFTLSDIDEYTLTKCNKKKARENNRIARRKTKLNNKQFEKRLFKYWDLPDELNANAMALYLYKNNRKAIRAFQNEMCDKFKLFYRLNGVR